MRWSETILLNKKNIVGDIILNKKTGEQVKLLKCQPSKCNRKEFMTVSDNAKAADWLSVLLESLGQKGLNASKTIAKNVFKSPGRAWEIGSNIGTAFASRNPKAVSSTCLK